MTINELILSGRRTIYADEAAEIFGCKPKTLRNSIQAGTCPFAFEASKPGCVRKHYLVSTVKLVNWLTCSHYTDLDECRVLVRKS